MTENRGEAGHGCGKSRRRFSSQKGYSTSTDDGWKTAALCKIGWLSSHTGIHIQHARDHLESDYLYRALNSAYAHVNRFTSGPPSTRSSASCTALDTFICWPFRLPLLCQCQPHSLRYYCVSQCIVFIFTLYSDCQGRL